MNPIRSWKLWSRRLSVSLSLNWMLSINRLLVNCLIGVKGIKAWSPKMSQRQLWRLWDSCQLFRFDILLLVEAASTGVQFMSRSKDAKFLQFLNFRVAYASPTCVMFLASDALSDADFARRRVDTKFPAFHYNVINNFHYNIINNIHIIEYEFCYIPRSMSPCKQFV